MLLLVVLGPWFWRPVSSGSKESGMKCHFSKPSNLEMPYFRKKKTTSTGQTCLQTVWITCFDVKSSWDGANCPTWPPGSHLESNHQQRGRNQTTVQWIFHDFSKGVHGFLVIPSEERMSHSYNNGEMDGKRLSCPLGFFCLLKRPFSPLGSHGVAAFAGRWSWGNTRWVDLAGS
jgi:hypothetical protein